MPADPCTFFFYFKKFLAKFGTPGQRLSTMASDPEGEVSYYTREVKLICRHLAASWHKSRWLNIWDANIGNQGLIANSAGPLARLKLSVLSDQPSRWSLTL